MEAPPDLVRASREALIALIGQQREEIAALRRENARLAAEITTLTALGAELTARVGALVAALAGDAPGGRPTTMPGLKPAKPGPVPTAQRPPRTRRAHGDGRTRMTPTARQVHAYATCPACRTPLQGLPHALAGRDA